MNLKCKWCCNWWCCNQDMAEEGDKNKQESLIFRGCSVLTSYRSCLVWWRHDTERIRGCLRLIKLGFIFRCPSSQYLAQAVMQIPITCCIKSPCNQPTLLLCKSGILSIKKFRLAHSITAYIMGYVYLFDTNIGSHFCIYRCLNTKA